MLPEWEPPRTMFVCTSRGEHAVLVGAPGGKFRGRELRDRDAAAHGELDIVERGIVMAGEREAALTGDLGDALPIGHRILGLTRLEALDVGVDVDGHAVGVRAIRTGRRAVVVEGRCTGVRRGCDP